MAVKHMILNEVPTTKILIIDVENEFMRNVDFYGDPHGIANEMLKVFKIFKGRRKWTS